MNLSTIKTRLHPDVRVTQLENGLYALSHPTDDDATCYTDSLGYLIAEQFEAGSLTIAEIIEELQAKYRIRIQEKQILDFLVKANSLGLLEPNLESLGFEVPHFDQKELEFKPQAHHEAAQEIEQLYQKLTGNIGFFHRINRQVLMVSLFAVLFFTVPWPQRVHGPVLIQPLDDIDIRAATSGRIERVFNKEGDFVEKNHIVVELEGYRSDILKKQAEIKKVDAELAQLKRGATGAEINEVQKQLELAGKITAQASDKHKRYLNLKQRGLIADQEYDEIKADWEIRQREYERAKATLDLIRGGTRPEIIKAKQAEREALLVDLKLLENMQERSRIRSPIAGIVATKDTHELNGKLVGIGDFILKIANPKKATALVFVRERDIVQVTAGTSELKFKLQSVPTKTFSGIVSRISPIADTIDRADFALSGHFFRVYADLPDADLNIKPGMTGSGVIVAGWKLLGLNFFKDIITSIRVKLVI